MIDRSLTGSATKPVRRRGNYEYSLIKVKVDTQLYENVINVISYVSNSGYLELCIFLLATFFAGFNFELCSTPSAPPPPALYCPVWRCTVMHKTKLTCKQ